MMSDSHSHPIFVYGTLRTGGAKHGMIAGGEMLRAAKLRGTLYDLGPYPAALLRGHRLVHGELWTCPAETVRALDAYEGVGNGLFRRVTARDEEGTRCWIWVAGPGLEPELTSDLIVQSGRWRPEQ